MRYRILIGLAVLVAIAGACTSRSSDDSPASATATSNPAPTEPSGSASASVPGAPEPVIADPDVPDPRRVNVTGLTASVADGRPIAEPVWFSGVAPCHQLQRVDVERNGADISVSVWEGGDPNAICVELAVEKVTSVDLGDLEPGSYTVTAVNPDGSGPSTQLDVG